MENHIRRRGTAKAQITKLEKFVDEIAAAGYENADVEALKVRLERLEYYASIFEEAQREIEEDPENRDNALEERNREAFEEQYIRIKAGFRSAISRVEVNLSTSSNVITGSGQLENSIQALADHQGSITTLVERLADNRISDRVASTNIKLPNIELPIFSGNFRDWVAFRDLFKALVHDNDKLSPVQKLQYLKTSLKGDALSVVRHLAITNANYEAAWSDLHSRFDKEKLIIEAHIRTIMEQTPLTQTNLMGLKRLYNVTAESIQSLKALTVPVDHWDYWLNFVIVNKLDAESKQLWARQTANSDKPTFDELLKFIRERLFELESIQGSTRISSVNRVKQVHAISINSCPKCLKPHELTKCAEFKSLPILDRKAFVGKRGLCYICLNNAHMATQCLSKLCSICRGRHHELLHFVSAVNKNAVKQKTINHPVEGAHSLGNKQAVNIHLAAQNKNQVLLPTAIVLVRDSFGTMRACRALLDSGSQTTLITEKCIQGLGLKRRNARFSISGISPNTSAVKYSRGEVYLQIDSKESERVHKTSALILDEITTNLPFEKIDISGHPILKTVNLADPNFYQVSGIDVLLGADIVLESLKDGEVLSNGLVIRNTEFGWIVGGRIEATLPRAMVHCSITDIDRSLRKFWEIEEAPSMCMRADENDPAEVHYKETIQRMDDGRYMVRLPFLKDSDELGSSRQMAMSRLQSMEKRFIKNKDLKNDYSEFLREYLELNHMVEVNELTESVNGGRRCYLPHHSVLKPDSSTTKLRVVFDASCKTTSGISLNEILMTGPVIQPELVSLLLRFRLHRIGLCADIAKMYRQILIHPEDRRFQTILWRYSGEEEAKEYELRTVTYGMAPASFLATRTLKQLAIDDGSKFPEVKEMLIKNFYMDDLITGADSTDEAKDTVEKITNLLSGGGFELRKWATNSKELMQGLSKVEVPNIVAFSEATTACVKTLGLHWEPENDLLSFKRRLNDDFLGTKREMLSEVSRIFDPLGLIAPCIVKAKIMFQGLWLQDVAWDAVLPEPILGEWLKLRQEFVNIAELEIPRCVAYKGDKLELYGFADASERAYAAVIYLKSIQPNNETRINIIQAKTRVAPLQQISLPRLELCAAHLLAKVMATVRNTLQIKEEDCLMFTDSTTVLRWLSETPRKWTTFVANRVADIRYRLPGVKWRHIPSKRNPADCASRGIAPLELKHHNLWWHGPSELLKDRREHLEGITEFSDDVPERRICMNTVAIERRDALTELLCKYSSYRKLVRTTALCWRFIQNLRKERERRNVGPIKTEEINWAVEFWIREGQRSSFPEEIKAFSKGKSILARSKLASLNPFLDQNGILRVGSRLAEAQLPYSTKHPIILCASHRLAQLIVSENHIRYLHPGLQLMQAIIGQKYHIINSRKLIKREIRKCVKCSRYQSKTQKQQMGNLPKCRTDPSKPFLYVGVDYAGPVVVRAWKGRGSKRYKAYVVVFVCMATKAVHLELATDLSTDSFIAVFKRFSARRGLCKVLYSDNGTNFVGASRIFNELQRFLRSAPYQQSVSNYLCDNGIEWQLIPPSSPHFGGLWEAAVKSMKFHLKRVVGNTSLTVEEMCTLICQIEAILNSRPLCAIDDSGLEALTPAHFLVGGPLLSVPEKDSPTLNINRLSRWDLVCRLHRNLWKRWSKEYLITLRQRIKWKQSMPNLKVGDLVIVHEDNTPAAHWPLARITNIHPGQDGLVRVVTLRSQKGVYKSPITKLTLLSIDDDEGEPEIHGGRYVKR